MTNLEAYKDMSLGDVLKVYDAVADKSSLEWNFIPSFTAWLKYDYTAPVPPMLRICDKIRDRHKAIYDCEEFLKRHGYKLTSSKQGDVLRQTIYWLYDERPEAEVHYENEGKRKGSDESENRTGEG